MPAAEPSPLCPPIRPLACGSAAASAAAKIDQRPTSDRRPHGGNIEKNACKASRTVLCRDAAGLKFSGRGKRRTRWVRSRTSLPVSAAVIGCAIRIDEGFEAVEPGDRPGLFISIQPPA